jgi:hypothetical protein
MILEVVLYDISGNVAGWLFPDVRSLPSKAVPVARADRRGTLLWRVTMISSIVTYCILINRSATSYAMLVSPGIQYCSPRGLEYVLELAAAPYVLDLDPLVLCDHITPLVGR